MHKGMERRFIPLFIYIAIINLYTYNIVENIELSD
jgi:hypothetical protein